MLRSTRLLSLTLSLLFTGPALADEIDLGTFGEEEEEEERSTESDDDLLDIEDPDDDEWAVPQVPPGEEDDETGLELDEGDYESDSELTIGGPGQDTARIYREHLEEVRRLSADEEALAWERYLKKYYNTIFRERVEARLEELAGEMYDEEIEQSYVTSQDAGKAEINFAQPMMLDSFDPRDKIHIGFEWGYPEYLGLTADLEMQITREFSVHGGMRGRYTGPNVEVGAKYALIKSARTETLLTVLGDLHLNKNPVHFGIRPQVALGKRIHIGDFHIDAAILAGSDVLFMPDSSNSTTMSPRLIGGTHMTFAASDTVRIFLESSTYMKSTLDETIPGGFRFNTVALGLKFINRKSVTQDRFETGVGATVPYSYQWWGYHTGSISGDLNYFLDL
jgi:hypothetical protein